MSPTSDQSEKDRALYALNVTILAVIGQVGCLTLVIVFAALFGGLWLDNLLSTKPIFTVGLMVASVPVALVGMFWVVRRATAKLSSNKQVTQQRKEEENNSGY